MHASDKLKNSQYEHELRVGIELAREAGAAILEHYEGPLNIEQKVTTTMSNP
jgi:hypothetical protein